MGEVDQGEIAKFLLYILFFCVVEAEKCIQTLKRRPREVFM